MVTGHDHASGRPIVLPATAESELAELITNMANVDFPLTRSEIRQLAFEYANSHGIHSFREKKQSAGYYWFNNFLKAENLSAARAMAVNETQVLKWFEAYGERLNSLGVKDNPSQLWNFDETGTQNIHDAKKVVGLTGKQVNNVTAMEKGVTSTYLAGINAVGTAVPPMIIHLSLIHISEPTRPY